MQNGTELPKSLSQVRLKDFVNCRIRLQRLHDASTLTGWVDFISQKLLEVRVSAESKVDLNETFYAEMHGPQCGLGFQCTLTGVGGLEIAELRAKLGDSKSDPESEINLELFPMGEPKILAPSGECRKSVGHLAALAIHQGIEMECRITDLSPEGIGMLLGDSIPKGDEVELRVSAGGHEATVLGKVRYSRKVKGNIYRLGLKLEVTDRIRRNQWRQVCEALTLIN